MSIVTGRRIRERVGGRGRAAPPLRRWIRASLFALALLSPAASRAPAATAQDQVTDLCAELGADGLLTEDRVLEPAASPYRVDCMIRVESGIELRIESGVELRFGEGAGLTFGPSAELIIEGGAPGDVLLLSDAVVPAPGDWAGLRLEGARATLSGFTIRHAHTALHATVDPEETMMPWLLIDQAEITDSAADGIRARDVDNFQVANSLLRDNAGFGIHVSGRSIASIHATRFVGNGQAGYADHSGDLELDAGGNLAVGNGRDSFWIAGRPSGWGLSPSDLMPDLANEIRGELRVPAGSTLALDPGMRLDFDRDSRILVDGTLTAVGTILGPSQRRPGPRQAWEGIHVNPGGLLFLYRSHLMGAGAGRGAVSLTGSGTDDPEMGFRRFVQGNRFQQLFGTGLRLETGPGQPPTIRDNLIRSIQGPGESDSVGLLVAGPPVQGPVPELSIEGNRFGDVHTAVAIERAAGLHLPRNAYDRVGGLAVENRDLETCVPAPESWWGSPAGPWESDPWKSEDDCGPDSHRPRTTGAVEIGSGVDYLAWLDAPPPPMPRLEGPACGVTNRTEVLVSGQLDGVQPERYELLLVDDDLPLTSAEVSAEGRFTITVSLGAGSHRLAARSRQLGPPGAEGPLTSGRRIEVDPTLPIDPLGTRFVYGEGGRQIRQPLRDALGCAAGCAGAGGFAVLPSGESVRLELPLGGDVISATLRGPDDTSIPLQLRREGLWSTESFVPIEGEIIIQVEREGSDGPFECPGYIHLASGGLTFLDTGAEGEPILSEDFEDGDLGGWVANRGWALTDWVFHDGRYAVTDSPTGNYGPDVEAILGQLVPVDLTGMEAPELSFWHRYRLAAGDRAWVEARAGGGAPWRRLADYEASIGEWRQERVTLDDYAGGPVQLRFRLHTDNDPETVDDGWTLDDIRIGPGGADDGRHQPGEPSLVWAEIELLWQQPDTGAWLRWAAEGQRNPQTIGTSGQYGFYDLEPGAYRARVRWRDQAEQLTAISSVTDGRFDEALALRPAQGRIYLPYASSPPKPPPAWMQDRSAAPYHAYLPILVEQSKQTVPGIRRFRWSRFGQADGLGSNGVRDIEIGPDGSAWLVSSPVYTIDRSQGRWQLVELLPASIGRIHPDGRVESRWLPESLDAGDLYDLVVDEAGEIWIAADQGLVHLDERGRWRLYTPPGEWRLDGDRTAVARDAIGTIWYPTCDTLFAFSAGRRWQRHALPEGLDTSLCDISKIVIDPDRNKWLIPEYGDSQVFGFSPSGQWSIFEPDGFLADDFEITDIAYAPNGDLWIVGWWGAFHRSAEGRWRHYNEENSMLDVAESVAIDEAGNVWLGSSEMGSLFVRWADGTWQGYRDEEEWSAAPDPALPAPPWRSMGADMLATGPGNTVWMRDGHDDLGVVRLEYGEEALDVRWP